MYPVSTAYLEAINQEERNTKIEGAITLKDSTVIDVTSKDIVQGSLYFSEQCFSGDDIDIGSVYASEMGLSLITDISNPYTLDGARISLNFGIEVSPESWEYVPLGYYYITDIERKSRSVNLKALDGMIRLDVDLSGVDTNGTTRAVVLSFCSKVGITLATDTATWNTFPNTSMSISLPQESKVETCRDLLMWICQLLGCFARMNRVGQLEVVPVVNRESVRTIDPDYRFTSDISDFYVEVTKLTTKRGEIEFSQGIEGTTMVLEENPFLVDKEESEINTALGNILPHLAAYVPFNTDFIGDPALQAGDFVDVQLDMRGANLLLNSSEEKTGSREYVKYTDLVSIFDKYGVGTYTFSFDLKSAVSGNIQAYCTDSTNVKYSYPSKIFAVTTEYIRYFMTVNVTLADASDTVTSLSFYGTYDSGRIPSIKNVKIEKGNNLNPEYTPAINEIYPNADENGILKTLISHSSWKYRGTHNLKAAGKSGVLKNIASQGEKSTTQASQQAQAAARIAEESAQAAQQAQIDANAAAQAAVDAQNEADAAVLAAGNASTAAQNAQTVADAAALAAQQAQGEADAATLVAQNAASAASSAVSTADAAQAAANNATNALSDMTSDDKLTPDEKQTTRKEWDVISAEKSGIVSQASSFSVSSTAYTTSFQSLANYLNNGVTWSSGIPSWISDTNLGITTNIVGSTFRERFKNYYDARTSLLNAISAKAKQLADAAQVEADNAASAASSAQSTASSAATAASNAANAASNAQSAADGAQQAAEAAQLLAQQAHNLATAANQSTQLINDAIGGNVLIRQNSTTNEILIMDSANPAQARKIWRWNMGGLGYSDNVVGADNPLREYEVAMTMDGAVNAVFVKTGLLQSLNNLSWISLDNGTFNLGGKISFDGVNFNIDFSDVGIIAGINASEEGIRIAMDKVTIGRYTEFEEGEVFTWQKYTGMTWEDVM